MPEGPFLEDGHLLSEFKVMGHLVVKINGFWNRFLGFITVC